MKRVFFGWQNVNMNTDSAPLVAFDSFFTFPKKSLKVSSGILKEPF